MVAYHCDASSIMAVPFKSRKDRGPYRYLKGTAMIELASQWYATMIYWLPVLEITGNRPVSSVYSLLMCVVLMCISLSHSLGIGSVGLICFLVGLVDRTCCRVWTIWPLMVSLHAGQYLVALWYVSPGHKSKFPALIALSQVSCTGKPPTEWKYCIRASTLGIS